MLKSFATATAILLATTALTVAQTPRKGGTIRFTAPYGANFASMDIHATNRSQDEIWGRAIHRTLYRWDANANKSIPELCEDVKVSDDGMTYTYKLRKDIFFHNGRALTADDVIWSFTRIMDGGKAFPGARYGRVIKGAVDVEKGQAKEISGLKKIDDNTFTMTLAERVDPAFNFYQHTTSIYPAKEAQEADFANKPIGLGPYKFVEHVPGSRLVAERFDKYFEKGKPYADKVVIAVMGEAAARDVAFRNKEIDASILGSQQYVAYKADANLSKGLLEVAESFTRIMGMNTSFKPFSDVRVRQAINHAIDTDLIIKRLVKDKAYRATSWLPTGSAAFDKEAKPYAYDPDKAKALLKEAGYADGFEFEWTASANESWGVPIVEAIVPMLAKVGITAKIKPVEATVLNDAVRKGEFQAFIYSLSTGPDPAAALKCFHSATPQSACNYTLYKNPEVDKLLDEANATTDQAKKIAALKKVNNIVQADAPYWFFNYNKAVMAYQPWVHGLQPNANELAVQEFAEVWIDETSPAK
jgi:peptide/nickel transport system substrate-binding protein